jgi:hypothetical protein
MIYLCVVANYGLSATNKYHEKPTTKNDMNYSNT